MPLKPIFDKAPLMAMTCQPLRAGMVRTDNAQLRQLYALAAADAHPAALEGAFRLACLTTARPAEEPVAARIRAALSAQKEDGSFDMPLVDSIAVLRAGWALYEYEARKPLLEPASRWCAWAVRHLDALLAEDALWENPADLLELLQNLYRVTGLPALLTLSERVSSQTMPWSSVLNTISAQRPTKRTVTLQELQNGLTGGAGREDYYPRLYRTSHAESLADGVRASMARGWLTGSATEMNAARSGWERLQRHHGAVCGGLTSDELLEGTSPSAPISTAAVGAWAEALCSAAMGQHAAWAWDAAERLALNAIPACLEEGGVLPFQRVNTLSPVEEKDCFIVTPDHALRAMSRLSRGWAAILSCAVTACPDGLAVNLYLPGRYAVPVGEGMLMLNVAAHTGRCDISIHCKQPQKAQIRLRLPEWSRNIEIAVNGSVGDSGRECRSGTMSIDRTWNDGDVISVAMEESLRILDGHHQGCCVMRGATLMALPVTEDGWQRSLVSAACRDDQVVAVLDEVKDWRAPGGVPADVPVLPAASGNDAAEALLVPYAAAQSRIALFPRRKPS
ncbi:MAG: hypothetical protein ACI4MG_01275 [Aristaeellaceae bacterium]